MNSFHFNVQKFFITLFTFIFVVIDASAGEAKIGCEDVLNPLTSADVILAIRTLHENHEPLNHGAMELGKSQTAPAILEKALGRKVGTKTVIRASLRKFGSWNAALTAAGIDPASVRLRKSRVPLRKLDLIAVVKRLDELGVRLTPGSVSNAGKEFEEICLREFGYPIQGRSLFDAAGNYHGGWYQLMAKTGIPRERWQSGYSQLTRLELEHLLRVLEISGLRLNANTFRKDPTGKLKIKISSILGRTVSASTVYAAGVRFFGSWPETLLAVGIAPEAHIKLASSQGIKSKQSFTNHTEEQESDGFWTDLKSIPDAKVIGALIKLHRAGVDLRPDQFLAEESVVVSSILRDSIGLDVSSFKFYYYVKWRFLSWSDALSDARIFLNPSPH